MGDKLVGQFGHTEIHSWATSLSPWSELGNKLVGQFGHTEIHSWATSLSPWSELGNKLVGLVMSAYVKKIGPILLTKYG
jgi:hypothetical protein